MENKCACTKRFRLPRGNKGFEDLLLAEFAQKQLIPHENNTPALTLKCCCMLTGKIGKAYNKTRNIFCFDHLRHFSPNLEPSGRPKLAWERAEVVHVFLCYYFWAAVKPLALY